MKIRDRIRELRRVKASELLPNEKNWRTHSEAQANALRGLLAEVGFASAVLAYETPAGLKLIDGHLRGDTVGDAEIPVLVLDVDDAEAAKLLACFDPLGAMAETDVAKLDALLEDVKTDSPALQAMLNDLGGPASNETGGKLKELEVKPPPKMTWVLLGLPTVRFGEVAETVELLAAIPGLICETTSNDDVPDDQDG